MTIWKPGIAICIALVAGCDQDDAKTVYKSPASPLSSIETFILSQSLDSGNAVISLGSTEQDSQYRCRHAEESEFDESTWQDCRSSKVTFPVAEGQSYVIEAAAVSADGRMDSSPARLDFVAREGQHLETTRVEGKLVVTGVDQLAKDGGEATLEIEHEEGVTDFSCLLNEEEIPCSGGIATVDLDGLDPGSYQLQVSAMVEGEATDPVIVNFCVGRCSGDTESYIFEPKLQIGDFYEVEIPENMHVTEFSTSITTGPLSFYRIMSDSDEYYLGNTRCERSWDRLVETALNGVSYRYCHSTPTRSAYKLEYEYRMAYNHIEVATDARQVHADNHERLSISVYDEYEYRNARSRFYTFCKNATLGNAVLPSVNDFFRGRNPEDARIWYCDATIPNPRGGVELWKVAALIEADGLDWGCTWCRYPRAIEMVYMARPSLETWRDDRFVRMAQEKFLDHIRKIKP